MTPLNDRVLAAIEKAAADAAEAKRSELTALAIIHAEAKTATTAPEALAPPPLATKAEAARALGISTGTLDRFVASGAPVHHVGDRRRFDLQELRGWLDARGPSKRPAVESDPIDVGPALHRAGLRSIRR